MIKIKETDLKKIKTLHKIDQIKVYSAKVKFNHLNVCVKKIETDSVEIGSNAFQEALTLARFSHPNVVKIYNSNLIGERNEIEYYSIIMEYFEQGNLGKLIKEKKKSKKTWNEDTLLYYANQLIHGLAFLQEKECAHRDIKPENILVSNFGRFLKISDFGDCIKVVKYSMTLRGSPNYLSPILRNAYNQNQGDNIESVHHNAFKSDVFSLGLTLLYMATNTEPTNFRKVASLGSDINKCIEKLGNDFNSLKILLRALLEIDEERRPDFIELKEQMNQTHFFDESKFCIKCQNYYIYTNFIQIYDTFYCEIDVEIIKSEKHKCLECKKIKNFEEVYLFENKPYCKKCLSLESLKVLPLYCSICRDDIKDNCTCNCGNILRCKVCKLRQHEGVNCIRNAERMIDFNFEALYKCECENILVNQKSRFFFYCKHSTDADSSPILNSYCWVCEKSEDEDHPLCKVFLEYSNFLK